MIAKKEESQLRAWDRTLLADFTKRYPQSKRRVTWQNKQLESLVKRKGINGPGFNSLRTFLEGKDLFEIKVERRAWRDRDGKRYVHSLVRAATTEMWPMGAQYWVRDNAIIGARLLRDRSAKRRVEGKKLLLSGLNFMSSCSQLQRFERIVRASAPSFATKAGNWPHIFASVHDNLGTERQEPWAHKQDAWQILVWHTLDALESGVIRQQDLNAKNLKFFGLIIPFLAKVSFWKCENSGSWEEIPAVRSSVRVWEHRLVVRLGDLAATKDFRFLRTDFARYKRFLSARVRVKDFHGAVALLDRECTKAMLRDLPYEAPCYAKGDPRYREADAALLYLLELDYPDFLAERSGKDARWARALERSILAQVLSLQDDRSDAICRYGNDTYQRSGFFRNLTVKRLNQLLGAPGGDASDKFAERDDVVPKGRKAAWTHFVWQVASWAGRRYLETHSSEYRELHERFFLTGLRLVTEHSKSFDVDAHTGRTRVVSIPAWKMPECYIADVNAEREELLFPSPHTPLNWATAEMLFAFYVRDAMLATSPRGVRTRAA